VLPLPLRISDFSTLANCPSFLALKLLEDGRIPRVEKKVNLDFVSRKLGNSLRDALKKDGNK